MQEKTIKTVEDLMAMLDSRFRPSREFWDPFYAKREKPVPFFTNDPDENLVSYLARQLLPIGRALDSSRVCRVARHEGDGGPRVVRCILLVGIFMGET